MMLRSRRHRQGEPIGCRCHHRTVTTRIDAVTTVSVCEPSWKPLPPRRRVRNLPDLRYFNAELAVFRDAMMQLRPVSDEAMRAFRRLKEVTDAGSE